MASPRFNRRACLAAMAGGGVWMTSAGREASAAPMRIAALITEWRENSHADVIVRKFIEGSKVLDVDFRPQVKIASLYLDQVPPNDLGREMSRRHAIPIYPTISQALTQGGERLAVDGVLLIGEHGNYPYNEKGQHLYPRRRFFDAAAEVMEKSGRGVPLFNDKHLSYSWQDARHMVETARRLRMPLMAGSSLPVTWRRPPMEPMRDTPYREAMVVAYGPVESYGFHALETLQCMVERRRGGETGVKSVQCLTGADVWTAAEQGRWDWNLLTAALARSEKPEVRAATRVEIRNRSREPEAFLVEYRDGLRATVLLPHGFDDEFLFAGRVEGRPEPETTLFWLQEGKPFGHFARLSQAIERMFLTGKPDYPVERTLLTTGILDALMQSRFEGGKARPTPELDVRYRIA